MDRNEKLVCGDSQNSLTNPIQVLGHQPFADLGNQDGDDPGVPLDASHGQTIAANGQQSFGPLEPGALYEFTHAPLAAVFQPDNNAIHYRVGNQKETDVDEDDLRMHCTPGHPYFRIKLQPDQTYVNFFSPTGAGTRGIEIRRLV